MSRFFYFSVLLLVLAGSGCGAPPSSEPGGDAPLTVVATTDIIADVVEQIAGPSQPVLSLVETGNDIHSFQPSPRDVATVAESDVLFLNGLGLETFLQPMLDQAEMDGAVIDLSDGIEPLPVGDHDHEEDHEAEVNEDHEDEDHEDHDHGPYDPHVWLDPTNVVIWADEIAAALAAADPANAAQYQANAEAYKSQLDELDAWIVAQIEPLPPNQRRLVVDHETLAYYAARYDLQQLGTIVEGISSMEEPSARALAELQEQIETHNVPAIFVSASVNRATAETLAADLGIEVVTIYAESLSPPDGPAATYLESMRYNTSAITEALR